MGVKRPKDLAMIEGKVAPPVDSEKGEQLIKEALIAVYMNYNEETAMWVERIWRWETGHFKHGYTKTAAAGMHPWGEKYPWGWKSLKPIWDEFPELRPIGYTIMTEGGTGKKRFYLVFKRPSDFALTLAALLNKRARERYNGNIKRAAGSWYSSNPISAWRYANKVERVKPVICRELFKGI